MKTKSFKRIITFMIMVAMLIPSRVLAATHNMYTINTSSFSTLNTSQSYYISSGNPYNFTKTNIHEVVDNGERFLAYCLHDGLSSPNNASGNIGHYNGSTMKIYNKFGTEITGSRLDMLRNILATGFQFTGNVSGLSNASNRKHILTTQILVWEVMDGSRTGYGVGDVNAPHPNSYDFVQTDAEMLVLYKSMLSAASQLAGSGKPSSFGKTYTMHWNDGQGKYVSPAINVSIYSVGDYDKNKISVSGKDSSNNITISSKNEVTTAQTVNFKFSRGSTLHNDNVLRIFLFSDNTSARQNVLLSVYQANITGNLSVKTESGKFKLTKKDSNTKKNLKGAVFKMYKCSSQTSCDKTATATIDMKSKEVSSDITLKKSGLYVFKETTTPTGYEKLDDFYVKFSIADDGKVSATIDSQYQKYVTKNAATDSSILNLNIYNDSKYFRIKKVDGLDTKKGIVGATFNIKKSDGTVVKFTKESAGHFVYDTSGTVTNLRAERLNTYTISMLPKGSYILEEVKAPYPYLLAGKEEERQIKFKIVDGSDYLQVYNYNTNKYDKSSNLTITAKNFKSRVEINKTGENSKPVAGVVFELYDNKQENKIPLKLNKPGLYEYDPNGEVYELVTNSNGRIKIDYLPAGTYQLKEIRTPEDSGLVIDPNNIWTKFTIRIGRDSATPYGFAKEVRNAKGQFCFYKIDEDGNYLDSGKFALRKYNETSAKYEDLCLLYNSSNKTFSIDTNDQQCKNGTYTFSPVSEQQTCFVGLDGKGKYRVVEIEAPAGFVLPSESEKIADISINEYGYATGDAVIINKKITTGEDAQASAELIVNIQTGQNRIHYIIIIGAILLIASGLIVYKKKIDKK